MQTLEIAKSAFENSLKMLDSISKDRPVFWSPGKVTPSWSGKGDKAKKQKQQADVPKKKEAIVKIKRGKQKHAPHVKEAVAVKEEYIYFILLLVLIMQFLVLKSLCELLEEPRKEKDLLMKRERLNWSRNQLQEKLLQILQKRKSRELKISRNKIYVILH